MPSDYNQQIVEFWPTIMRAWDEHGEKHPVIECDVVRRKVAAMPAKEYINGLTARTRKTTLRQYAKATAQGGMMVFMRDSKRRVLQSQVFTPVDTA
jgi:hypothetical protein